jgi:adenylosuccinate synthase
MHKLSSYASLVPDADEEGLTRAYDGGWRRRCDGRRMWRETGSGRLWARSSKIVRKEERTMEENSQTEQELSEEQLGEISGGCGDCYEDRLAIISNRFKALKYRFVAKMADSSGFLVYPQHFRNRADEHDELAQEAQARIAERHPR